MTTENNDSGPPGKGAALALVTLVLLVVGGLWLQRHMHANALMEDCLMAGRRNCDAAAN
jgi:hypothetical protein